MKQANVYSYRFLYFKGSSHGQYESVSAKDTSYIHDTKDLNEIQDSECNIKLNNGHAVTKFYVVQLITLGDVDLHKDVPPFTVLRKPSLLVAGTLVFEGQEVRTMN